MRANDHKKSGEKTTKSEPTSHVPPEGTAAYADWADDTIRKGYDEADE
jgi:hypothetical protein